MNSVGQDIKEMLENDPNVEVSSAKEAYPIHVGVEPAQDLECITIFETNGYPNYLGFNSSDKYEYPSIQIRVRTNDYQEGWALCDSIKNSLHGRANETFNGTFYAVIYHVNGPAVLDIDDNNRIRFIMNFNIQRR